MNILLTTILVLLVILIIMVGYLATRIIDLFDGQIFILKEFQFFIAILKKMNK